MKKNKPFFVDFGYEYFKKKDILKSNPDNILEVMKYYRNTWWRRFLEKLGFDMRIGQYKVRKWRN